MPLFQPMPLKNRLFLVSLLVLLLAVLADRVCAIRRFQWRPLVGLVESPAGGLRCYHRPDRRAISTSGCNSAASLEKHA